MTFLVTAHSALLQLMVLGLLGFALGLQNAVARSLAVPDLTTTVLTLTITGISADLRKRDYATMLRRSLAISAMLLGAFFGAVWGADKPGIWAGLSSCLHSCGLTGSRFPVVYGRAFSIAESARVAWPRVEGVR